MLHVHRSERADGLVAMLGEVLAVPLEDPLQAEVVVVPTRGIERWLTQQLSKVLGTSPGRADGACGNVELPFPGKLLGDVVARASAVDPETDPWGPNRAVWYLLDILDQHLDEPWLSALRTHLSSTGPAGELRRFAAVRRVADLFDRYGVHRPDMLLDWAAGRDSLAPEDRWQAGLWRLLRERVAVASPPERTSAACERLRSEPHLAELPRRVAVFGVTRLPASYLDVLGALASARDVHLFLLHPSPVVWEHVAAHRAAMPAGRRSLRRRDDDTAEQASNALLRSWGQEALEMQRVLDAVVAERTEHHRPIATPQGAAPTPLLARVQADVRADRAAPGAPRPGAPELRAPLDVADDSIRIHGCHGRARQVEVLRDAVLHLFDEHPDLETRDVVVMCPDIETYAPLVHATFGAATGVLDEEEVGSEAGGGHGSADPAARGLPAAGMRVRLADRSLRQTNPLLGVVAQLLELAASRVSASQVLDLAGREPVGRRFGIEPADLTRLEEWVASAGIRWGLDAEHRAPFRLGKLAANTWRSGFDRILLGVTMADEGQRQFGGAVPLDDVDSGDIDLTGRFAELLDRLETVVQAFTGTHTVGRWGEEIRSAVANLTDVPEADEWQRLQLHHLVDDLARDATMDGTVSAARLGLADMTALLADRLRGRPTRANFRTGHLTICTLVPMRSVPHRVVCLLGLDDGSFPRHTERDGDDLVLREPRVGDQDARNEDRQLLLDALLAATDHLVVTYSSRDERTNLPRPPAVPLGELIDAIDRTAVPPAGSAGGARARDHVVVHHPLQPFDVRCFTPGELVPGASWSYDPVNLAGARAMSRPRRSAPPFLGAPLADWAPTHIELVDLERFVGHPVRAFLRTRLGISLGSWETEIDDALPVELSGLEEWDVGERLLAARLAGADIETCIAAERGRGHLPPGALAEDVVDRVATGVDRLVGVAADPREPRSLDVNVRLDDGTMLVGTVAGVRGETLCRVTYSKVAAKQRLVAWVQLLALTAARPELAFDTRTIGRAPEGASRMARVTASRIPPLGGTDGERAELALGQLATLVDLYRRAMREPVPLFCKTSSAWATATREQGTDAVEVATREWRGDRFAAEDKDAEHQLVFGGTRSFQSLLDEPPQDDEAGAGWDAREASRFGRYAHRLWGGLLDREQLETI